MNFPMQTQC